MASQKLTRRSRVVFRAIPEPEGDALPTEFVVFTPGVNESFNGPCLYDSEAEANVLAEYERHGVRLIVDLEHDSLDSKGKRPDSRDARGWFDLEARDGSLWAVNVEWTDDGARRLRGRTQRYISPAFLMGEDERVICLLNVALCSMPATYGIAPLVRSQLRDRKRKAIIRGMLTPEITQAAMAAIAEKDGDAALTILNDLVVAAASGDAPEASEAEMAGATSDEPSEPEESAVDEAPAEEPEEEEFAARALKPLEARLAAIEKRAAEAELGERCALVARLVACGAETPATAWAQDGKGKTPVARLANEPIAELRSRTAALEATRKVGKRAPSAGDEAGDQPELKPAEQAWCKKHNVKPQDFVARKAAAVRRAGA